MQKGIKFRIYRTENRKTIPDMMVVITGATAEIADPIPPATAPMIPAACWMVGTRVMITGPMPDMAVVTAGAIWLNPDEYYSQSWMPQEGLLMPGC